MTVDDRPFGTWLLDQLQDRDWTYRQLAVRVGVHRSTVGHWVSGRSLPEPRHAIAIADAFGIDRDGVLELAGYRPRLDVSQVAADRGLYWAKRTEHYSPADIALVESLMDQIDRNRESEGGSRR